MSQTGRPWRPAQAAGMTTGSTIFCAAVLAVTLAAGCSADRPETIFPPGTEVRPGDILLRRGDGMASRVVLFADGAGEYSHVGIAADSAGVTVVVHAVPGEPRYPGEPDMVRMEPVGAFYSRMRASRGCVMRCADSLKARRAAAAAVEVCRRGTLFDHDYDSNDTTAVYCSELVERVCRRAGMRLVLPPRHNVSIPGLSLRGVIMPSDFRRSPSLRVVAEF